MMNPFSKLSAVSFLIFTLASSAFPWFFKDKDTTDTSSEASAVSSPVNVPTTYLDTLNAGREVVLTERDFSRVQLATPAPAESVRAIAPANGFRIQCLVTSQIDRARIEQKAAEANTHQPVYIIYQEPYYKVHIGDFTKRESAEELLQKMRKDLGYPDAFIIVSPVQTGRH